MKFNNADYLRAFPRSEKSSSAPAAPVVSSDTPGDALEPDEDIKSEGAPDDDQDPDEGGESDGDE